jgi:molybdate transport system substrate-binding protein
VMTTQRIDELEKEGRFIAGTRRALARTGIGIAAREGGPKLDLSTEESTRAVLLAARSISYSFSDLGGTSGGNSQKVLARLGIADAVKAKLVPIQNDKGQAMIGTGEIEMGLYNVSEIPRAKGVVRAGALPASVQVYSSYAIAVPATNKDPAPALAYRDYLLHPAQRSGWESAGLEAAR